MRICIHRGARQLAAQRLLEMLLGGLSRRERDAIREQLEAYRGRDTEGMIWIIDRLRDLATGCRPATLNLSSRAAVGTWADDRPATRERAGAKSSPRRER